MKLTKNKLKQIIREELENAMSEVERPKTTEASRALHAHLAQAYDRWVAATKEVKKAEGVFKQAESDFRSDGNNYLGIGIMYGLADDSLNAAVEVQKIAKKSLSEIEAALKKMKSGK